MKERILELTDSKSPLTDIFGFRVVDQATQEVVAVFARAGDARLFIRASGSDASIAKAATIPVSESDLRSLRGFAINRGWFEVPGTSAWEELRLRHGETGGTLIAYRTKRGGIKVVVPTGQRAASQLIESWNENGRASS